MLAMRVGEVLTLCALGVRDAYLISAGLVGLDPLIHAGTVGLHGLNGIGNRNAELPAFPRSAWMLVPLSTECSASIRYR